MANELELLTENAAGNGWVDSNPGDASTGYNPPLTTLEAVYSGVDHSSVSASGADVIVAISGPVDDTGLLFPIKTQVTLSPPSAGTYYIRVIPGSAWNRRSLELTTETPTFDATKNGFYDLSGRRVLNWGIAFDGSVSNVYRITDHGWGRVEKLTGSGSWTVPAGISHVKATLSGGGSGGGGGSYKDDNGFAGSAGGSTTFGTTAASGGSGGAGGTRIYSDSIGTTYDAPAIDTTYDGVIPGAVGGLGGDGYASLSGAEIYVCRAGRTGMPGHVVSVSLPVTPGASLSYSCGSGGTGGSGGYGGDGSDGADGWIFLEY